MPEHGEEQLGVTLADVKAGVTLQAGHRVVIIVDGVTGTRQTLRSAVAEPDEAGGGDSQSSGSERENGNAADQSAGPPPDEQHPVRNSRWGKMTYDHGEQGELLVDTHASLEGKQIEFVLERREGEGAWSEVARVRGIAQGGVAKAALQLDHAGVDSGRTHFRFKPRVAS